MNHLKIITELDEADKKLLSQGYGFNQMDLEDVYTYTQLSKIEGRTDYLYVALQFPEYDSINRKFLIKEVHFFVSQNYLVIVDKDKFSNLDRIFKQRPVYLDSDNYFDIFYELFDAIVTNMFKAMAKFKYEISELENDIFDTSSVEDLLKEILIIQRNLINFESVSLPLQTAVEDLQNKYKQYIDTIGVEKLDDTLDKLKKIINNLNNFEENTNLLRETNEALINRSTNKTVKRLTGFSLIAIPATLITSFFGMNVYYSFSDDTSGLPLYLIFSLILSVTIGLFIYFKSKDWI